MIISLLKIHHDNQKIVKEYFNLRKFSFLTRGSIKELIRHFSIEVSKIIENSEYQEFKQQFDNGKIVRFYVKIIGSNMYVIVSDEEYPRLVGYMLIKEMDEDEKDFKLLQEEYADPSAKDLLTCVNQELDETKIVLSRTLEDVLGRGEKLDGLINSAENLSAQTKALFEMSKKQNRCC
ncbi:palmitoyltransferase [Conglomerata obtusa]